MSYQIQYLFEKSPCSSSGKIHLSIYASGTNYFSRMALTTLCGGSTQKTPGANIILASYHLGTEIHITCPSLHWCHLNQITNRVSHKKQRPRITREECQEDRTIYWDFVSNHSVCSTWERVAHSNLLLGFESPCFSQKGASWPITTRRRTSLHLQATDRVQS